MIQTERKGQKVGSCAAMSPGVRRMPAPMTLPMVTARPKVRPRTVRRDLRLDNAESVAAGSQPAKGGPAESRPLHAYSLPSLMAMGPLFVDSVTARAP